MFRLGLGDWLAWIFRSLGIAWLAKATGRPCRCEDRRRRLNELFGK